MDFADSATGTQRGAHDATVRGRQEAEVGVNNIEGRHTTGTAPTQSATSGSGTATQATTAPTVAPGTTVDQQQPGIGAGAGYGNNY